MTNDLGIIDKDHNPFFVEDWRKQNFSLTPHRKEQLEKLFELDEASIKNINKNEGAYPAFVGIRWGFAKMNDGKLTAHENWHNKNMLEGYGQRINRH